MYAKDIISMIYLKYNIYNLLIGGLIPFTWRPIPFTVARLDQKRRKKHLNIVIDWYANAPPERMYPRTTSPSTHILTEAPFAWTRDLVMWLALSNGTAANMAARKSLIIGHGYWGFPLEMLLPPCETAGFSLFEDNRPHGERDADHRSFPDWTQPHTDPPASPGLMSPGKQAEGPSKQPPEPWGFINPYPGPLHIPGGLSHSHR